MYAPPPTSHPGQVELPASSISGFNCCVAPELRHAYKYRHCKAAFCNLPHARDCAAISTKVGRREVGEA